jgi:hypothetical protein
MHRPPAASWEIGPARCPALVFSLLALLSGLLAVAFWIRQTHGLPAIILGLALLACVLFSLRGLRKPVKGRLHWDGERWHWSGTDEGIVTELVCVMDLQRCLLLRIACDQSPLRWLWLEARTRDGQWQALRRAIAAGYAPTDRDDPGGFAG